MLARLKYIAEQEHVIINDEVTISHSYHSYPVIASHLVPFLFRGRHCVL
jgi:hypothetical protein